MSFDPLVPRPIDLPTPVPLVGPAGRARQGEDLRGARRSGRLARLARGARALAAGARERIALRRLRLRGPGLEWTQSCFSVALALALGRAPLRPPRRPVHAGALLDEAEREYGGFDGVVLWHAYPVIGIDERNQFDFYRDVPGLRELVAAFQARGVRVFVDYNPWDTGTRREAVDDATAIAELVPWLGADGVFLDTMKEAMPGLREATGRTSPSRASRRFRSRASAITTSRGRSGSRTATCPA